MTSSTLENESYYEQDQRRTESVIGLSLPEFSKTIHNYLFFIVGFSFVLFIEILTFILFFHTFAESMLLGLTLGIIFLTISSFYLLRLYLQTSKSEKLEKIKQNYLKQCQLEFRSPNDHITLAAACNKFVEQLKSLEHTLLTPPSWLQFTVPLIEMLKMSWYWEDFFKLKELLLEAAIEEHIQLVKMEPTSLETHATLANAYVILSTLYNQEGIPTHLEKGMHKKFRWTSKRAIEELKILSNFAPNDPWIHQQLAYSYHDLQMPKEEIEQYEIIHRLLPEDDDCLYKLGLLYFQEGRNAKGLKIYEALKRLHYKKAERLIHQYGKLASPLS